MPRAALVIDKVDGLVQNESSFSTKNRGDVFLRKCCVFDYGKRPARPAKPVDTISHAGEVSPVCIPSYDVTLSMIYAAPANAEGGFLTFLEGPFGEGGGHRPLAPFSRWCVGWRRSEEEGCA